MWDGEYCQLVEKLFQLFSDKMKVMWDWATNKIYCYNPYLGKSFVHLIR